jgi:deoxyadenosine/deoxycytidine kinase
MSVEPANTAYKFGHLGALLHAQRAQNAVRRTNPEPPVVLVFEGLIAVGKSTFVARLQQSLTERGYDVVHVLEPVDEWKNAGILQKFYSDPERWAAEFQEFVLVTRVDAVREAFAARPNAQIYLLERSVLSDRYFFMKTLYDSGVVSDMQMAMYDRWWAMWTAVVPLQPSAFIWLTAEMDEIMARARARSRDGESELSVSYQQKLESAHHHFFTELSSDAVAMGFTPDVGSYRLDLTGDYRNDPQATKELVDAVDQWVAVASGRSVSPMAASSSPPGSPMSTSDLGIAATV